MRPQRRLERRGIAPALGTALGVAAAALTGILSTATAGPATSDAGTVFDATHLPPLLTTADEPVELEYDVHCAPSGVDLAETDCDVRGTAFVRAVGEGSFVALPLGERWRAGARQLAVTVPHALARAGTGVEYFAVLEAPELDRRVVLPAGGAEAPHVSRPIDGAVEVNLGRRAMAGGRRTGVRVASATWGEGPGRVGLEQGRSVAPTGASAFDVDSHGEVTLLDQVHRRILRWRRGAKAPQHVPVSVNGTLADLAVADDGSMYVLETTSSPGGNPRVRRFDDGGRELEAVETADRGASQLRIEARGPVVLGSSSHQWMPVMTNGTPASPSSQARLGRAGRTFAGGREVVVLRREDELRVAIVSGRGVTRSWRLTSATPLAEVQLAEPLGQRLVLVVRVYEEGTGDEFTVLVLGRDGLLDRFAVDSADWAETAPLGRFELRGHSLYRLGSSPVGAFVDRFELEVH